MKYMLKNHLTMTPAMNSRMRSGMAVALLVTSLFSSLTINSLAGTTQAIASRFSGVVRNSQSAITCDARALSWSSLPNMPSIRMGHGSAAVGDSVIIAGGYSALNVMHPTVVSYSLSSNSWAAIGTMPTPRGHPGVVAIENTLYTFGGHTSVQLYQSSNLVQSLDLSTNTWMTRSAMLSPRHNFAYALGNDNQIYVFGGETYTTSSDVLWGLSSAMVYSPTIDSWQLIAPMTFGREFAAAATGSDGRIYVTGGWQRTGPTTGPVLADVTIYDPQSNTWSSGPPLPSARLYHSAVAYGDSILVIGGDSSSGVAQSTVFEYVIGSNAWVTRTQTLSALSRASVTVTKDGQIVRAGGANGATWTASASKAIASLQWNPVPNMPDSRWGQGAAEVAGSIYVVGGVNTVGGATVYPTATHRLNLQTQTWSTVAQIPEQVQLATTVSAGGLLYVIGGYSPKTANSVNWVQVYDPTANTWYTRTAMPTARHFASGSLGADGKIYVAGGGRQSPVAFYSTVEAYDPTTDAWQTLASMPAPRSSGAMATLSNGTIAYFGGSTGSTFVSSVYVYSPTLNTWSSGNALPTVRANISAASYGNLTFILGGSTATSGASGFTRDVLAYESGAGLWQSHSMLSNSRAHVSTVVGSDGYLYSISGGTGYSVGGNIVERARLADVGCLTGIGGGVGTATPTPNTPTSTTTTIAPPTITPIPATVTQTPQPSGDSIELIEASSLRNALPGASSPMLLRVRNIGTTTWQAGQYGWIGDGQWAGRAQSLQNSVAPRAEATLVTENVTAPNAPGVYFYVVRMRNADKVAFGPSFVMRLIVGSTETDACPLFEVPLYKQANSEWAADPYGSNASGAWNSTMSRHGCATTSAAMVLSYYAAKQGRNPTTPKELNDWLRANRGYTSNGYIVWQEVSRFALSVKGVSLYYYGGANRLNTGVLEGYVCNGSPIILNTYTAPYNGHFVVAHGRTKDRWAIKDPGPYNLDSINADAYSGYRKFGESPKESAQITFYIRPKTSATSQTPSKQISSGELDSLGVIVSDPLGNKFGVDPFASHTYTDIADASISYVTIQDQEGGSSLQPAFEVNVRAPIDGNYSLTLVGSSGEYEIELVAHNQTGNQQQQIASVNVVSQQTAVASFAFNLQSGATNLSVENSKYHVYLPQLTRSN